MSDYLSNFATTRLGRADIIRPRLAALFEPPHLTAGPILRPPVSPAAGQDGNSSNDVPSERLIAARPPALRPVRRTEESQPSATGLKLPVQETHAEPSDLQTESRPPRRQATTPQPLAVALTPLSLEVRSEQLSGPLTPERPQPAVDRTTPPAVLPLVVSPFVSERPQQQGSGRPAVFLAAGKLQTDGEPLRNDTRQQRPPEFRQPRHRTRNEHVAGPEERRLAVEPRPDSLPVQIPRPETPTTVVVQPHVTPYVEPAAAAPTATPEPTIKVTIGRVEIRATPPPARQSAAERSAAPVMSLDEYLRRRAKRGGQ